MAAGELGMLLRLGWRGAYPGSKLYADFGHFLGVSQGPSFLFVRRVGRGTCPVLVGGDIRPMGCGSQFDPKRKSGGAKML
jgi:hypothetical protein